jgi:hypothetical protein
MIGRGSSLGLLFPQRAQLSVTLRGHVMDTAMQIIGWAIVVTAIFCFVAFARYVWNHRHEGYITLDCRAGNHIACDTCSCRCHTEDFFRSLQDN